MEYPTQALSHFSGFFLQSFVSADRYSVWNVDVARLQHEKDVLENGLANCVTYLHFLRKRQARNDRLLNFDPQPPRKKRKKIQQNKRELDKEIKNRERDEQAFLNNLRSCKANMYITGDYSCTPTELSPMVADYASSTTQCSYEESGPMEISWTGWTDDAATSPFARHRIDSDFTKQIAPDELNDIPEEDTMTVHGMESPPSLFRNVVADIPHAPYLRSPLSPAATTFEPTRVQSCASVPIQRHIDKLNKLSWLVDKQPKVKPSQDPKETAFCKSMQSLHINTAPTLERRGSGTWCNASPQQSSPRAISHAPLGIARTNSL